METLHLDFIPCPIDLYGLMKRLHVRPDSDDAKELECLVNEAVNLARPKVVYGVAFIDERGEDWIVCEGVRFDSKVLRVNLEKSDRIFPFLCTCGMELQEWGEKIEDMIGGYWAEAIKEEALRAALDSLFTHLDRLFKPGHTSTMSPGSLENWPITQQAPLFGLLGNPSEVKLTESQLMIPTKSVSGIIFPIDGSFESCQLCPRINCPNRRAPYDETLYEREYCPAQK
jgi:hypothetical protein